jgi:predicted nucleic acid-binding protein
VKYLVDANVLSEPTKVTPNLHVVDWLRRNERELVLDPIVLGEVRYGILKLPRGRKRSNLEVWFDGYASQLHCLAWDSKLALAWAELLARLRAAGRAMPIKDSLVAATALAHNLIVVTRDRTDFDKAGVRVLDPFAL